MPFVPVINYQADWSPTDNTYQILVGIRGNPRPVKVPVNSEAEYLAVLMMLGKAGVLVESRTGSLQVPVRPVGT